MSGYRNLHRQQVLTASSSKNQNESSNVASQTSSSSSSPSLCPIWHVQTTSRLLTHQPSSLLLRGSSSSSASSSWRIWTAAADGLVRSYLVQEKSLDSKKDEDVLDASALQLTCTHVLVGDGQQQVAPETTSTAASTTVLGCTRVSLVRNYVGDDESAGQMLVASMEMAGRIRIWQLEALDDDSNTVNSHTVASSKPTIIKTTHEFVLPQATGTTLLWCPPRLFGNGPVLLATACLDGTIALVASGFATPASSTSTTTTASKKELAPGTVVATIGSSGTSLAMSLTFSPSQRILAVGRQDGSVDMFQWTTTSSAYGGSSNTKSTLELSPPRHIRLSPHVMESPIRAVSFTTDGQLIMAGSDQGMICIWNLISTTGGGDTNNTTTTTTTTKKNHHTSRPPQLVHHILQAHASWIMDLVAIDHRRFVSCGMDQQLHVWNVGQIYQPVHSFSSDHVVWSLSTSMPLASTSNAPLLSQQQEQYRLVTASEQGWLQVYSLDGKV